MNWGHSDVRQINNRASTEVRRVENEMMVIMQEHQEREQNDVSHNSFHSSFSRVRSEELNNMGFGLNRISPITFDDDAFWTPNNRAKGRALTLTPRKQRSEANTGSTLAMQTSHPDADDNSHKENSSVVDSRPNEPSGRFVPPQPNNTGSSAQGTDSSNTMVYHEKSNGEHQSRCASIQTSPRNTVSTGAATTTQSTNQKALQAEGTQTTPPASLRKPTATGGDTNVPPQKMNHTDSWARINQITSKNINQLVLQQVRARRQKIQPLRPHLILDHLQDHQPVQEMTSHQEIWVLADLQFSVQHVVNIHTGEGNAHMTIFVQHVKIMTMLHTCVGLTDKPATTKVNKARKVPRYPSTVEALNTVHLTAEGDLGTIGNNHMIHLSP